MNTIRVWQMPHLLVAIGRVDGALAAGWTHAFSRPPDVAQFVIRYAYVYTVCII